MTTVNIHEAKTHLSALLRRVAAGEEVVIARAGHPVARIVRAEQPAQPRVPGSARGEVWMADDFDTLSEDELKLFEEGPIFPEEPEGK
ncbi:MAG: type II toxin-antitoxin system Phd/YefM family antitoxin [Phycisphaerae bacterium]|nr:type II toxin-antitoxin system Phd/YefM family antitoxin [Phycisphaerae bacterium]